MSGIQTAMESVQRVAAGNGDLLVWTIYDSPSDYPGEFVVRPYSVADKLPLTITYSAPSLEQVRAALPAGLVRMTREAADDPTIVETWV